MKKKFSFQAMMPRIMKKKVPIYTDGIFSGAKKEPSPIEIPTGNLVRHKSYRLRKYADHLPKERKRWMSLGEITR